jgi:hypothetical protein
MQVSNRKHVRSVVRKSFTIKYNVNYWPSIPIHPSISYVEEDWRPDNTLLILTNPNPVLSFRMFYDSEMFDVDEWHQITIQKKAKEARCPEVRVAIRLSSTWQRRISSLPEFHSTFNFFTVQFWSIWTSWLWKYLPRISCVREKA